MCALSKAVGDTGCPGGLDECEELRSSLGALSWGSQGRPAEDRDAVRGLLGQ